MEDTMSSLTRTMLPALALAAMMSIAQAQTAGQDQDHDAHHPGDTATMPGQGMGSGAVVQQGTQQPGGQPGMMMNMDHMRSMMGGMMGQQNGQPGMMGNMGQMMPMMITRKIKMSLQKHLPPKRSIAARKVS